SWEMTSRSWKALCGQTGESNRCEKVRTRWFSGSYTQAQSTTPKSAFKLVVSISNTRTITAGSRQLAGAVGRLGSAAADCCLVLRTAAANCRLVLLAVFMKSLHNLVQDRDVIVEFFSQPQQHGGLGFLVDFLKAG